MVARAVTRVEERGFPWWWVFVQGCALLVLGVFLLARPGMTLLVTAHIVGLFWFTAGIMQVVSIFLDSSLWGWKLAAGLLGILAGVLVIRHPLWSSVGAGFAMIVLLGVLGIISGSVGLAQAIKGAGWSSGILAVVNLVLGLILLANAWVFTFSLAWTIGVFSLLGGFLSLIVAFRVK